MAVGNGIKWWKMLKIEKKDGKKIKDYKEISKNIED